VKIFVLAKSCNNGLYPLRVVVFFVGVKLIGVGRS